MELAISIVVGVLLIEVYAWLPKISEWLIDRAVFKLLPEDQARCREEWKAGLEALPNSGAKLLHAFSFSFAVRTINAASMEANLEQIGHELEVLSGQHVRTQQQMLTLIMKFARMQRMLPFSVHAAELVGSLRAIEVPANAPDTVKAYENAVNALESFVHPVTVAFERLNGLTDSQIGTLSAKIEQADIQVHAVLAKYGEARELCRKRKLPSTELVLVLKHLNEDLRTLRAMVADEGNTGENDVRDRERKRIMTALQGVIANHSGKR